MHGSGTPQLRATYRVQLLAEFTLRDAVAIVPYLHELGVSHLYASPILAARAGSRHGYDVVDPRRINPELGTEDDLVALARALHERAMGLVVDIVPNHMGVGHENRYWEDVLTHGERSPYARWFDIDWRMHPDRRLVLPILSDDLDAVIARRELRVEVSETGARLRHFGHSLPVSPDTEPESLQLAQWDPEAGDEARGSYAGPAGEERLRALLARQHYRLAGWRRGPREINYRRFFDISDLVAVRAEDPEVFAETHALILRLVGDGVIDGLRVDHIDGLREPGPYLARLRAETDARRPGGVPVFVEKILMHGERLRRAWPVDGTTGYERLNDVEDLFIDGDGFTVLERRYRGRRRSRALTFEGTVRADKRAVLDRAFAADVERLSRVLAAILDAQGRRTTREQIFHGIEEFIAAFPVYRGYVDPPSPPDPEDARLLADIALEPGDTVANRVRALMAGGGAGAPADLTAEFVERMQQLTGPAMAKGLEDTAHYAYVPLVSRNEVGGAPDRPLQGAVESFHRSNAELADRWPRSLVALTTHDTKRSADVRARVSALSEIAPAWHRSLARWRRLNRRHQTIVRGRIVPDPNAELLLYQTLVGIWPAPRPGRRSDDVPDRPWRSAARERVGQYMRKAVREAQLRTSWIEPDVDYERALDRFIAGILESPEDDPFLSDLSRLVSTIAPIGLWNTLSRTLLHLTIPGTPDIYQGDESWNFSLVDPDNRRPVDYTARQSSLASVLSAPGEIGIAELAGHANPKTLVIQRALAVRRTHPPLFAGGAYTPLAVMGPRAANVIAFARSHGTSYAVVVAPRLVGALLRQPVSDRWRGTVVELPVGTSALRCAITGRTAIVREHHLLLEESTPDVAFGLFVPVPEASVRKA